MRVILIALFLMLPGCAIMGASEANREIAETCAVEDTTFQCSVNRAYALHSAITDQVRSGYESEAISGVTARNLVDIQKDVLAFIDQANAVGEGLEGYNSLNRAEFLITEIQRRLIDKGVQL